MEEQLISFETAKVAKEKGFDVLTTNANYEKGGELGGGLLKKEEYVYLAPTQSLLQKWIWEKYDIWIEITLWGDGLGFCCVLKKKEGKEKDGSTKVIALKNVAYKLACDNPYEILEVGLQEALKLIK